MACWLMFVPLLVAPKRVSACFGRGLFGHSRQSSSSAGPPPGCSSSSTSTSRAGKICERTSRRNFQPPPLRRCRRSLPRSSACRAAAVLAVWLRKVEGSPQGGRTRPFREQAYRPPRRSYCKMLSLATFPLQLSRPTGRTTISKRTLLIKHTGQAQPSRPLPSTTGALLNETTSLFPGLCTGSQREQPFLKEERL